MRVKNSSNNPDKSGSGQGSGQMVIPLPPPPPNPQDEYLKLGLNKTSIAKLVGCAPNTLYSWLDRHNLRSA